MPSPITTRRTLAKGAAWAAPALTVLGALIFLGIKFVEYKTKFDHGLLVIPWEQVGPWIDAAGAKHTGWFTDHEGVMASVPHGHLFFSIYFTMTAIHGLHVIIGAGLIVWIMKGAAKGRFHAHYFLPVDLVGLYWHLVDLIWIFLFPLLYLVP